MLKEGDSKLSYRLEKMVQNLLNEFVIEDKTFRVSTPVGIEVIKRIFGHALTPKHLGTLSKHDGIVVLFSDESQPGKFQMELKPGSVERRNEMKSKAQDIISKLEKYLGKPVLDVWEGIDQWKNIFGNRSIYICCMFALDESGFTNIVV